MDGTLDKVTARLFTTAVGEQQRQSAVLEQLMREIADLHRAVADLTRAVEHMK